MIVNRHFRLAWGPELYRGSGWFLGLVIRPRFDLTEEGAKVVGRHLCLRGDKGRLSLEWERVTQGPPRRGRLITGYERLPFWRQKKAEAAYRDHRCPGCNERFGACSGLPDMDGIGGFACRFCGEAWTDWYDLKRRLYRILWRPL